MKTLYSALIVFVIAACGGAGSSPTVQSAGAQQQPPSVTRPTIVHVAGTIRQSKEDPTRWDFIIDEAHTAHGIAGWSAEAKGEIITIKYAEKFSRIVTFIAGPDETFAKAGYAFGASVNRDRAHLKSNAGLLDGSDGRSLSHGNIWFYGVFEI